MNDQPAVPDQPNSEQQVSPEQQAYALPATPPAKRSKKSLIIGVSLAAGVVLLGAAIAIPLVLANQAHKNQLPNALEACGVDEGVVAILDDGDALDFTSATLSYGATGEEVFCVLHELGAPQSIETKIGQTRSLDGTREADWDGFAAQWTYHPDSGLNLLVERDD